MAKDRIVTREVYKKVKKYDRQQFEEFCKNLYMNGMVDGMQSVSVDVDEVMEAISSIRGIGEKRVAAIKEVLERMFNNQ